MATDDIDNDIESALLDVTGIQYEHVVRRHLSELAKGEPMKITVQGKHEVPGSDGVYEIDGTVEFEVMGVTFLVLIECKNRKRRVDRDAILMLSKKLEKTGGHKGIVFSPSGFQRGAIQCAKAEGIALIKLTPTGAIVVNKARGNTVHGTPICNATFVREDGEGLPTTSYAAQIALLVAWGLKPMIPRVDIQA